MQLRHHVLNRRSVEHFTAASSFHGFDRFGVWREEIKRHMLRFDRAKQKLTIYIGRGNAFFCEDAFSLLLQGDIDILKRNSRCGHGHHLLNASVALPVAFYEVELGFDEVDFVVVSAASYLQGDAALVVDLFDGGEDVVEVGGAGA